MVTQADWQAGGKGLVDAAYPVMKAWVWLDRLLPFFRGYRLIVSARRRG